jgi:hypothetical protein
MHMRWTLSQTAGTPVDGLPVVHSPSPSITSRMAVDRGGAIVYDECTGMLTSSTTNSGTGGRYTRVHESTASPVSTAGAPDLKVGRTSCIRGKKRELEGGGQRVLV